MNDHSSRSHTILTVHITSEQQAENEKSVFISKQGKINFVGKHKAVTENIQRKHYFD